MSLGFLTCIRQSKAVVVLADIDAEKWSSTSKRLAKVEYFL